MVLTLAAIMSMSAFADNYYLVGSTNRNRLNVVRNNESVESKGKPLSLWSAAIPGTEQTFKQWEKNVAGRWGTVIVFATRTDFAVNCNSYNGRAILYHCSSPATFNGSALVVTHQGRGTTYQLKFGDSAGQYLKYAADQSNAAVSFGSYDNYLCEHQT